MATIRFLRWSEDGHRSVLALTPGAHPSAVEEPAPDGLIPPGVAGIAVLEDPDGWLAGGAAPLGPALYAGPGLDTLLDAVAEGRVDERAPTQAAGEILIDAEPDAVWAVLADVKGWPTVRADIHSVDAGEPAHPGGAFSWSAGPNRITSVFGAVEPGRLLTYVSTSAGANFTHVYRTERTAEGRTLLSCRETLAGPVIAALIPSAALQAGVDSWLAGVKAVAEAS